MQGMLGASNSRLDEGDNSSVTSSLAPDFDERAEASTSCLRRAPSRESVEIIPSKQKCRESGLGVDGIRSPDRAESSPRATINATATCTTIVSPRAVEIPSSLDNDTSQTIVPSASKRGVKMVECLVCRIELQDSLVASHIYMIHINDKETVKCGYCSYGTTYAKSDVLRHCRALHGDLPVKVCDRRRTDLQSVYLSWRSICFPGIGKSSSRAKSVFNSICLSNIVDAEATNQSLMKCAFCEKYIEMDKREEHVWEEHLGDTWRYSCLSCLKKFSRIIDALSHCHKDHNPPCEFGKNNYASEQFETFFNLCFPLTADNEDSSY
ncbi:hypothetical protein AB6A40_010329 [Gnathostoma spinigerum]|uniref:C2H2-type domain-containing protein n=1 Tax=Gnathostoma spinigerum TaxID=75299 RepID=A0ABD6EVU5_9BILA